MYMKRLFSIFSFCMITACLYAGTYKQVGYIKEKSSDTHKGNKLVGVKIKVKNRKATYFSGKNGLFTLDGLDKIFSFEEISYKDYILVDDEDLVWKRETSSEPIKILMVSPKAFLEEAKRYYEPMLAEAKKNNSKLKIDNEQLLEQLRKKSERLAKIDYDELSVVDKEVRACLLKGEFHKADSLILSKGSIEERMTYGKKTVSSIVNDFKILSDNALIEYDIDKSIKFLENIIEIDPDNIPVLLDLGYIYCQYKSDVQSGQVYINQALFFAKKAMETSPTELSECYSCLGMSYMYSRNYKECIHAIRNSLSQYSVPNIPEITESSKMEIDTINMGSYPITTRKDTSLVNDAYLISKIIYGLQGKHRLAQRIEKLRASLIHESQDVESLVSQMIFDEVQNFQVGLYQTVIKDLSGIWEIVKDVQFNDNHTMICYLLAASYSNSEKLDSAYYFSDQIIQYYKQEKKNHYDQYYLGAWTIKIKTLLREEKYDEALYDIETVKKEIDFQTTPYLDLTCQIYNNEGLAYLEKQDYEKAIDMLTKANDIIVELDNSGYTINDINILINANLAVAYEKKDDKETALKYIYKAFSQAKKLYKEIGCEHPIFYGVVDQMYLLEVKSDLYKDAMETAILCYNGLDDEKDKYRKRIENCYKLANKSKEFKKTKEYKELITKYKEFIEKHSSQQ